MRMRFAGKVCVIKYCCFIFLVFSGLFSLVGCDDDGILIPRSTPKIDGGGSGKRAERKAESALHVPLCDESLSAKSVRNAIDHMLGFTEVRSFLRDQKKSGLSFCASGLTLSQSQGQYFRSLIIVNAFSPDDVIVSQTVVFFDGAGVQAHHSTFGRPWIVMNNSAWNKNIIQNLDLAQLVPGYDIPQLVSAVDMDAGQLNTTLEGIPGDKVEISAMSLLSGGNNVGYYLVAWLKPVTSQSTGSFTSQYSPKYAVVKLANGNIEILSNGSGFLKILGMSESLLEEANQAVKQLSQPEKVEAVRNFSL